MKEIRETIFIDSDLRHNKVMRKSISGLLGLIGSTPITWYAKQQSSIMTSTFGSEFTSLKKTIEEVVVYRYYC